MTYSTFGATEEPSGGYTTDSVMFDTEQDKQRSKMYTRSAISKLLEVTEFEN